DNYAPPRIAVGRQDENPVVLTRQDWRHFQGRPWAGGSNGKWLLALEKPLRISMQFYLAKNEPHPKTVRIMNGDNLMRAVDMSGDESWIKDVVLPRGDVDLWFELVQEDTTIGPYQVHLHF
ncbi:MAG: arylsulfatase, partial [Planctomycetes bacterium]|nr:arylsulfatase [Planctomycetota bacterium]